jgi:hypothetical protein
MQCFFAGVTTRRLGPIGKLARAAFLTVCS